MKRSILFVPVLLISMVGLAACGSEPEASTDNGSLFEFESSTGGSVSGHVKVQLPEGLESALNMDGTSVPVKSVTISARDVKSTSLCAIDGKIEFNEGGEKVASTPTKTPVTEEEAEEIFLKNANFALGDYGIIGELRSYVENLIDQGELTEADLEALETNPYDLYVSKLKGKESWLDEMAETTVEGYTTSVDEMLAENKRLEAMTGVGWVARFASISMGGDYGEEVFPMSKFNADAPEKGVYMDSTSEFIQVLDCAVSPVADGAGNFTFHDSVFDKKDGYGEVATFNFGVMKDGTVTIPSAKVTGYVRDSSGTWIKGK